MFSRFFIERPIFANVIALVTMIIGAIALSRLPVAQFPQVTPPTVAVTARLPGASAQIIADTVALPIEQQVNGVEHMLYMQSTSASDGSYSLVVTFEIGTDLDFAQVLVQNRLAAALPSLPPEVQVQGVVAKKVSTDFLQVIVLSSPDQRYDSLYLSNYALINLTDELARLPGVGDVVIFGIGRYGMRIWLNPEAMQSYGLTAADVIKAIAGQNLQVPAGQLGMPPSPPAQDFQYTVNVAGRLQDEEQFRQIIVKVETGQGGRIIRIKDVGRVELGAQTYSQFNIRDGKPATGVGVFQLPGANALQVAAEVSQAMARMSKNFPLGMQYDIPFDTTLFTSAAINEVYQTLFEAAALVLVVILIFLQSWRAVLVPATTVPVTIIGAFIAMAALGFSVNMITLFALILAVGIVVDDAIVIVEGATHGIEQGLSPKEATIQAMDELLGPILSITLVLMAVFLPAAFLPGVTGQLYRQFALVIAATALISAINALTLKPAQCASYLRPRREKPNAFYRGFNHLYAGTEKRYTRIIQSLVRHNYLVMALFAVLFIGTMWSFVSLPTGFLPDEDLGYAIVGVLLPDSASLGRTSEVMEKVDAIVGSTPGVAHTITVGGNSILDNRAPLSNAAVVYTIYDDFVQREKTGRTQDDILADLRQRLSKVEGAATFVLVPPAIRGLGIAGGFQLEVQLKGAGFDFNKLGQATDKLMREARKQPEIAEAATAFRVSVPQVMARVDRIKAETLDVDVADVFTTLQTYLGSFFVNQFNKFGRTYQVYVQADHQFRLKPEDIGKLYTRNAQGQMVPLGTVTNIEMMQGPAIVSLYNLYPSAAINGRAATGYSSGQALHRMEALAAEVLPRGMGYEWTGMSYQERIVGNQALFVFGLSTLLVFMVLAALYESWTSPAAVVLVVPLALLGTVLALAVRGSDNNIYTQIGVVLLIALASKNSILIVEYARSLHAAGKSIEEAAVEASRRRLRPILMTSFAFILGVLPLVFAGGAGAASRQALGTAVVGGMLTSTLLAILFVPVFYVITQKLSEWWASRKDRATAEKQPF
jgi:hydrophobic/amphiphilic exporter-1 (mainly G- bacteria), HAE1 family